MATFSLKDSEEYYLALSEQPKRFDADSPVTNVFFDDTNGQVFSVRSGGVTGVTVTGMDDTKCTSFRMEDKGPIISIKFSPDHKILAIQRNQENQNPLIEFVNFPDLAPTNVEYSHSGKWKSAKILGFVWPKANEIAFVTDHGIELLQVFPEKKQLKSLKSISFSGAWFSWCAQSNIIFLAGNNGALLQPFLLNNSTITKLQKLELETGRAVAERDVLPVRLRGATWCGVFRHADSAAPTEVWLLPVWGTALHHTHVLRTGLLGRFALSVVDHLVIVHHQSSQTSQVFDIMEEAKVEGNMVIHTPVVPGGSIKPAAVGDQPCPMYSSNWVVFQPDYIIDALLGCLWRVRLVLDGLPHSIPKDEIPKMVAALLRRTDGKETVIRVLRQLVDQAGSYLVELNKAFDEINAVYRKWEEIEIARNTAGSPPVDSRSRDDLSVVLAQSEVCARVLQPHADHPHITRVVTAYLASLCRCGVAVQPGTSSLVLRLLASRGAGARLRALARRGCVGDDRPLACQLLALGHVQPAAAQLALDMMARLNRYEDIIEVLLGWDEPVAAAGTARQAGAAVWGALPARKLLQPALTRPPAFRALYHAAKARHERLPSDQCNSYADVYKNIMSE